MEDHFSWSDSVQAAFSCLPCIRTPSDSDSLNQNDDSPSGSFGGTRGVRRARANELEGLLADAGDTDTEAETMSLHSNIGSGERRRKKKRGFKKITVFGWNLFGKPPIQLPDDDDDALLRRHNRKPATPTTLSSATLDSDAAQLDSEAIEQLQISSAQLDARAAAAEAEDKRLKEERRQLRRERKELQRAAKALALAAEGANAFEGANFDGFPGSTYRNIPSPFQNVQPQAPPQQLSPPPLKSKANEGFGIAAYFTGQPAAADPDSDDADLGGQLYARRATSGNSNGSDSRSRTSASVSNPDQSGPRYNHYTSQPAPHQVPLPRSSHSDAISAGYSEPPRKTKSSRSKSNKSQSSKRSSSTSQSISVASPLDTSFPASPAVALPHSPFNGSMSVPREEFEGFPMDGGEGLGFPSAGFGGGRGKARDMGAFLADRGDTQMQS